MIKETFKQAIQNVWSNKVRTFLTMLGIIIGVMAVIVIANASEQMLSGMRSLRKPRELLIGCRKSIPCLRSADRIANTSASRTVKLWIFR